MGTPKIRKVTIVRDIEIEVGGRPGVIERHVQVDHHESTGHMYTLDPSNWYFARPLDYFLFGGLDI